MMRQKKEIGYASISLVTSAIIAFILLSSIVSAEDVGTMILADSSGSQSDSQESTPMFFFDNFAMYMIIIFGIFSSVAFMIVTYVVYRGQGFFGPWIIFSIIAILFLFSEFTLDNLIVHRRFVAAIMFLFFAAALFRYWDAIELSQ